MNGILNRYDFTYMVERMRAALEKDIYKDLFQEYSTSGLTDSCNKTSCYHLPPCETYQDMKEVMREEFCNIPDPVKLLCYKITDSLMFYRDIPYIFVLFSPEMVAEIYNIFNLLKGRKKRDFNVPEADFPVTTGDIVHKYISDVENIFFLFPSFEIVRKIRILLETDIDKIIDEFVNKLKKLDRIIRVVDFQDDSVFKDFLEKIQREGLDKKLSSIASDLSCRFFVSREEEENIKKIFDLLIEAVKSLKVTSLSGEKKLSKVNSVFSLIIDSKKTYKELNKELIRDRELIILFNDEIKNNCKAIGCILKKVIQGEEEFIARILKEYYFSCLSRETGYSETYCKEAFEIVKNVSEKIEKKKMRETFCCRHKPPVYPAIIIKELYGNFLVNIPPYIPEHIVLNHKLPWNIKEEAKNELEIYRRYCDDLKKLGSFLSEQLFPCGKLPDVMKKIYKIQPDYTVISSITGIAECELLKILLSEFLQLPDGSVIPLRLFLARKKDFLNDNCEEIRRHINKDRSDNDIAQRLNKKYDYLPVGWLTGKDIKEFRRKNNIVKNRGRKRKFSY